MIKPLQRAPGTRVSSWPSLIAGCGCLSATIIVLYGHVRHFDDLGLVHLWIALGLIVAVLGGYNMSEDATQRKWARAVGFAILFAAGTFISVGLSGSRSSAIIEKAEKEYHDAVAKQQKDYEAAVADRTSRLGGYTRLVNAASEAKANYERTRSTGNDQRAKVAGECSTGGGTLCKGQAVTTNVFSDDEKRQYDIWQQAEQKVTDYNMPPTVKQPDPLPIANPEVHQFAKLWTMCCALNEDAAFSQMKFLFPLFIAIISEFGSILFFHKAWSVSVPHVAGPPVMASYVSVAQIAKDMGITANFARKTLRQQKEPCPAQGWVWQANEAERIRRILFTAMTSRTSAN